MNSSRKTTLLSITLGAVLLSGIIAPSLPKAYALPEAECFQVNNGVSAQDDICVPFFSGGPNSVFRAWSDPGIINDNTEGCLQDPDGLEEDQSTPWFEGPSVFTFWGDVEDDARLNGEEGNIEVFMPNFIDPLPFKDLRIQLTFCPIGDAQEPLPEVVVQNMIATDDGEENDCQVVAGGTAPDEDVTPGATYLFEDWHCHPNPDFEEFDIVYDEEDWLLVQIVVDTWSYGEEVGGIFEGVNTAALLVAGAQANALWLIPLITAIGVGIVIVNRKRFF